MVYNMGGGRRVRRRGRERPAAGDVQTAKNQFRWINHTLQHPNLDCSTTPFITQPADAEPGAFNALIAPAHAGLNDPAESSRASTRASPTPGQAIPARSIRRPSTTSSAATGGTLPAGTYEYA